MVLLVGGYTQDQGPDTPGKAKGISAYEFLPGEGRLDFRGYTSSLNPSYLAVDGKRKIVYAVNEAGNSEGAAVVAYRVHRQGSKIRFKEIGRQPVAGDHPCFLTIADRTLLVCSYSSGHLHVYPLDEDGNVGTSRQDIHLRDGKPHGHECRDTSHAHSVAFDARRDRLYVCDLGCDRLTCFGRGDRKEWVPLPDCTLLLPPNGGGGPRHIVLHPNGENAVVDCELLGKAHLLELRDGAPTLIHTENYLPERVEDQAHGAAIRLSPDGKNVFVSDRQFSVITTLRIDERSRSLSFRDTTPCGGEHPRDIILTPDGKWLLSANLASHSISIFATTPKGVLKLMRTNTGIPSPTSMAWLKI